MAQCTRDMPPGECTGCLIDHLAVMYRELSIIDSEGDSIMGLSCYLRYQVNEPIHITGMEAVPLPPPPPPAEPPTGSAPPPLLGNSKTPALMAALMAAAAVTLLSAGV